MILLMYLIMLKVERTKWKLVLCLKDQIKIIIANVKIVSDGSGWKVASQMFRSEEEML